MFQWCRCPMNTSVCLILTLSSLICLIFTLWRCRWSCILFDLVNWPFWTHLSLLFKLIYFITPSMNSPEKWHGIHTLSDEEGRNPTVNWSLIVSKLLHWQVTTIGLMMDLIFEKFRFMPSLHFNDESCHYLFQYSCHAIGFETYLAPQIKLHKKQWQNPNVQ
jgi:hypothetical protein